MTEERRGLSRRAMLRGTAIAGMGVGLVTVGAGGAALAGPGATGTPAVGESARSWPARRGNSMMDKPFDATPNPRFGIIGVGNRGESMMRVLLAVPGAVVTAVCDNRPDVATRAARIVTDAGRPEPAVYSDGDEAYEQLVARDDVDFVYVATPWEWHTPMALAAMRAGKHVGVECPMGVTIEDLWELVDTSEQTGKHCIQLENCLYGQTELRLLNMVRAGKFGQLLHGSGAYLHDLRGLLFQDQYYADNWRRAWHTKLDTDLYPTHGLAAVASYMGVQRGDRFARMTTMSTPALGLAEYRAANVAKGDPSWDETYVKGDVTMSLIQTVQGRVIHLVHGISGPHPYSRLNHIAGTKGVFEDYPARIYLEPDHGGDEWRSFDEYGSFDHWLWTDDVGPGAGGHDHKDYLLLYRLVQCLTMGLPPDIDVYDSAAWSAPLPLGVMSLERGNAAAEFPDFTRDGWNGERPGLASENPA